MYSVFIIPTINILAFINFKITSKYHIRNLDLKPISNKADFPEENFKRSNLTKRETEITKLIIEGKSNDEIKDILFISHHTVKNHIYIIYKKVGVKSRTQLIHSLSHK